MFFLHSNGYNNLTVITVTYVSHFVWFPEHWFYEFVPSKKASKAWWHWQVQIFFHFLYSLHLSPGNSQEPRVNYSNFIVATSGFSLMIWESQESLQFMLQSSFIFTWLSPCFEDDFCKPARPSGETYSLRNVLQHLSFFTFWVHWYETASSYDIMWPVHLCCM